ncbi:MAG: sulfotransferase family protein [Hyphomonadaceae bacterium]|nr:sulfotransferase family protein [Hyphomonadaceae bacterium]
MCIVSLSHGFVFIHVPKSGGSSVASALSALTTWRDLELGVSEFGEAIAGPYRQRFGLHKHAPAHVVRKVLGSDTWSALFTFGFVRAPEARLHSLYAFLKTWRAWKGSEVMDRFSNVSEFVQSEFFLNTAGPDDMFMPQTHWLCEPGDQSRTLVKFVARLERGDSDFAYAVSNLAPPPATPLSLPHVNQSEKGTPRQLSPDAAECLRQRWASDFTVFGYAPSR